MSHHAPHPEPTVDVDQHAPQKAQERRSWALLVVTLAAQILVVLDISVVNTALPSIGSALSLSGGDLQWLVTAYLMMSGGGLLLGGRVADLVSRRTVFLSGLALFTVASLVSGFAADGAQLIAARAVQGLSAALLTPSALSLITTSYEGAQRRAALALWGAVGSLGVAAGVLVGGAVTTWSSWQFIFWINVPVGLVALAVGLRVITKDAHPRPSLADFDLPGATALVSGLAALIYGLGGTATHGWWSLHTLVAMGTSATALVVFLTWEARATRPLFPPHVWKLDTLVSSTVVMLGASGILVGAVFLTSILLQTALGFSAVETGVAFLPFALAITVGTIAGRHLIGHATSRMIASVGMVVVVAGTVLLSLVDGDSHYTTGVLPGLLALGFGVGIAFVAVSITSMSGVPASHAGVASGFLMTGQEIGAALGVAILSAVAATAGSLASTEGVVDAFARGFVGAAVMAGVTVVYALARMPASRAAVGTAVHLH
ncbi:MAG: MFS transporter [Nocardioidaceae bacterium]|nr:MFS transporter [Nocardioidaceae bacterium]